VSVCLLVMFVSLAKTAEPIEMPFEEQTRVSPTNQVLDGDPDPPSERGNFWGLSGGEKHYGTQKTITASVRLLQLIALLPAGRCHINFPP